MLLAKAITSNQVTPVDAGAAGTGILVYLQWAPEIAGVFTIIWLGLRIFIALRDEIFNRKSSNDK